MKLLSGFIFGIASVVCASASAVPIKLLVPESSPKITIQYHICSDRSASNCTPGQAVLPVTLDLAEGEIVFVHTANSGDMTSQYGDDNIYSNSCDLEAVSGDWAVNRIMFVKSMGDIICTPVSPD